MFEYTSRVVPFSVIIEQCNKFDDEIVDNAADNELVTKIMPEISAKSYHKGDCQ